MQLTKKFSADELRKGILSAVAFQKDVRRRFSLNENIVVFGSRWQSAGGDITRGNIYVLSEVRRQLRINRSPNGISVMWIALIEMQQIREAIIITRPRNTCVIITQYTFAAYLILDMKYILYSFIKQNNICCEIIFCKNIYVFRSNGF